MLKERLRKVVEEAGVTTQAEFAAEVGIELERVKNLLTGRVQALRPEESQSIQRKYGWRDVWLRTGKGPERLTLDEQKLFSGAHAPAPALARASRLLSMHKQVDGATGEFVQCLFVAAARGDDAALEEAVERWLRHATPTSGYPPVRPDTMHAGTTDPGGALGSPVRRQTVSDRVQFAGSNGAVRLSAAVDGEIREYQVIEHITERVCAGKAASSSGVHGSAGAAHTAAGPIAFERGYMAAAMGRADEGFLSVTVEGDSMSPALLHGDLVVIDSRVQRVNVSGIYVLRFDGDLTIKRVTKRSDGSLVVSSDNPQYSRGDEQFTRDQAATLVVIGRMVWPRVR